MNPGHVPLQKMLSYFCSAETGACAALPAGDTGTGLEFEGTAATGAGGVGFTGLAEFGIAVCVGLAGVFDGVLSESVCEDAPAGDESLDGVSASGAFSAGFWSRRASVTGTRRRGNGVTVIFRVCTVAGSSRSFTYSVPLAGCGTSSSVPVKSTGTSVALAKSGVAENDPAKNRLAPESRQGWL